jgi:ATP-binding cassette, subfamily B, bacterial
MNDICTFSHRPLAFLAHYVKRRRAAHGFILASVLGAVTCSIGTQYGVKMLVDSLAAAHVQIAAVWIAFATLAGLIVADNLLRRLAMYVGSFTWRGLQLGCNSGFVLITAAAKCLN